MANSPGPSSDWQGNEDAERGDDLLQLNRPLLLARLERLKACPSVEALRHEVVLLGAEADDPGSDLRAVGDSDEATVFGAAHLSADLEQIADARTLERAAHYIDRLIKGIVEVRTGALNDINLNRWKAYGDILTDSLWMIGRRDSTGAHSADYWGNYIPQIPYQMMRRYTRPGDWVLDAFAGLGTTLIEAQRLGRNSIGVELQAEVAARARQLIAQEPNRHDVVSQVVEGDSAATDMRALLAQHGRGSAQLVMLHPPYFDIIKFSEDPRDLSNAPSVEAFLERLGQIVENVAPVLDRGRYMALVIGDKYARGDWVPLGFLAMQAVQQRGFALKSIVVKNFEETTGKRAQKELWRYRALAGGFYIFKHEYIFVFRKQ